MLAALAFVNVNIALNGEKASKLSLKRVLALADTENPGSGENPGDGENPGTGEIGKPFTNWNVEILSCKVTVTINLALISWTYETDGWREICTKGFGLCIMPSPCYGI